MIRRLAWTGMLLVAGVLLLPGCTFLPVPSHQPTIHNPFPQLSKVAVAPFFNLSTEPTVDGRQFALAYFNELQSTPGFEVVPVGVVENTMREYGITLAGPEEARRLAQILEVDAVVVGAATDFTPYYPPRCGMQIEWYAANPCYHPIPPGYGLPWGGPEAEEIPGELIFEAELALAKEQLRTQTPAYETTPPPTEDVPPLPDSKRAPRDDATARTVSYDAPLAPGPTTGAIQSTGASLPADWPDPRGFQPAGPVQNAPDCVPSSRPVLQHVKVYNGHDADFTAALESYAYFRDDARAGGWQSYLDRSDDFIRFCCHLHIAEMLTARGGAGETRVVWRWPDSR